jgi:hypothetical protein
MPYTLLLRKNMNFESFNYMYLSVVRTLFWERKMLHEILICKSLDASLLTAHHSFPHLVHITLLILHCHFHNVGSCITFFLILMIATTNQNCMVFRPTLTWSWSPKWPCRNWNMYMYKMLDL